LCYRKWVKRQVERATNLNHRQSCAIRFNEIVLKPSTTSIFTFSVFRLLTLRFYLRIHERHELDIIPDCSDNESTFSLFSRYPILGTFDATTVSVFESQHSSAKIPQKSHHLIRMLVFTLSNIISVTNATLRRANAIATRAYINADRFMHNAMSYVMGRDLTFG